MELRPLGNSGIYLTILGLGGHEYLPDGRPRGFAQDGRLATTPGYIFEGFGGSTRKQVLSAAYELGINFFDVTQDSEKDALGRNLVEVPPPHDIFVQTRPEGMVYHYDENNRKMADYDLLRKEVDRILTLLRMDHIDFLNVAFMQSAIDHDSAYLDKLGGNIEQLKRKGLIRFATADTFSGEETYLRQIESGLFDAIFINLNYGDSAPIERVLPAARDHGMGVIAREAFLKGELFAIAQEAEIDDYDSLASAALKWVLNRPEVSCVVTGAATPAQLRNSAAAAERPRLTECEQELLETVFETDRYRAFSAKKRAAFVGEERR